MKNKLINIYKYKNSYFYIKINEIRNKRYRQKLTNRNFTIICSNCIGGIIYNRLGQRFNSPTINLAINNKEFCDFIDNFDYYISQEMIKGPQECNGIPVGILKGNEKIPDIYVRLIHYNSFEEGKKKWDERKKRINKDNIYVIMYDSQGVTEKDLIKVENFKCNNKIFLTSNPNCKVSWSFYIKPNKGRGNPEFFLNPYGIFGRRTFEKYFDFVEFLNKK